MTASDIPPKTVYKETLTLKEAKDVFDIEKASKIISIAMGTTCQEAADALMTVMSSAGIRGGEVGKTMAAAMKKTIKEEEKIAAAHAYSDGSEHAMLHAKPDDGSLTYDSSGKGSFEIGPPGADQDMSQWFEMKHDHPIDSKTEQSEESEQNEPTSIQHKNIDDVREWLRKGINTKINSAD